MVGLRYDIRKWALMTSPPEHQFENNSSIGRPLTKLMGGGGGGEGIPSLLLVACVR